MTYIWLKDDTVHCVMSDNYNLTLNDPPYIKPVGGREFNKKQFDIQRNLYCILYQKDSGEPVWGVKGHDFYHRDFKDYDKLYVQYSLHVEPREYPIGVSPLKTYHNAIKDGGLPIERSEDVSLYNVWHNYIDPNRYNKWQDLDRVYKTVV